jgi:hypothetical protein
MTDKITITPKSPKLHPDHTIAVLRREIFHLHHLIERARTYRGLEGWACPLCRYEQGVFIERCEPHRQLHEAFEKMTTAFRRLQSGDVSGATILLDNATKYWRGPDPTPEASDKTGC